MGISSYISRTASRYVYKLQPHKYILTCISSARQRQGKHCLKVGIAAETNVHFLGNGSVNTFTSLRSQQWELRC
jgi:hypothetical protein